MIVDESYGVFKVGNVVFVSAVWSNDGGGITVVNRVSKRERKWERVTTRQWRLLNKWWFMSIEQREFYRIGEK